jgi:endoglucanase
MKAGTRFRYTIAVALATAVTGTGLIAPVAFAAPTGSTVIRVDQVGYTPNEAKHAYAMSDMDLAGSTFQVLAAGERVVLTGAIAAEQDRGAWNLNYRHVYDLDVTEITRPGNYTIVVAGAAPGTSPQFRVDVSSALFTPVLSDITGFFTTQRDGENVIPGELQREPAHLLDRDATVYETDGLFPFEDDEVPALLKPVLLPGSDDELRVDAEGGWFDAGDYLKFVETTSYAVALMSVAEQQASTPVDALGGEIQHGLDWLDKMWHADEGVLYSQVGLGIGNSGDDVDGAEFIGDHEDWRLPEADDALGIDRGAAPGSPGAEKYFLQYRPVFAANAAGDKLSPNLAGRLSASFAFAAQRFATSDPDAARDWLTKATQVYQLADTNWAPGTELVSTQPHGYYGESSWLDDMSFGATELSRAARALGNPAEADRLLVEAAGFADRFKAGGLLNLYDTSALANTELVIALRERQATTSTPLDGLVIDEAGLISKIRATGLAAAETRSSNDPFRAVANYSNYDVVSNTFGSIATAALYKRITGDTSFDSVSTAGRGWALGSNAWGLSFVIGSGSDYPQCPHHQIGNLLGDGTRILRGAVVNGPNSTNATRIGNQDWYEGQAKLCPSANLPAPEDRLAAFQSPQGARNNPDQTPAAGYRNSRFWDWSGSWATAEPSIDFTASALLAMALLTSSDNEAPAEVTLEVTPNHAKPGDTVTAMLEHLEPGVSVTLGLTPEPERDNGQRAAADLEFGTGSADPDGTLSVSWRVPDTFELGSYRLTAVDTAGSTLAEGALTIEARVPETTTPTPVATAPTVTEPTGTAPTGTAPRGEGLAHTGASPLPWYLAALMLLVVGIGATLTVRRSRS